MEIKTTWRKRQSFKDDYFLTLIIRGKNFFLPFTFVSMGQTCNTRERLIDAAIQLMREQGYGAVGVEDICQLAGVNKGSFYHFFSTKADLAVASLDYFWKEFRLKILEPCISSSSEPKERLQQFIRVSTDRHREIFHITGHVCGCLFGSLGCEISAQEEKIRSKVVEILQEYSDFFRQIIQKNTGQNNDDDIHLTKKAQAMVAFVEGMLLCARIGNDIGIVRNLTPYLQLFIEGNTQHESN